MMSCHAQIYLTLAGNAHNPNGIRALYDDTLLQSPPDAIDQLRDYINKIGTITKVIFCINALTFIIQGALKISILEYVSCIAPIFNGQFYRIITSAFSHASLIHIALNMASLVVFSPILEAHNGTTDYLIINLFLYNAVGSISLLMVWVRTLLPESLYGGEKFYFLCSVGYSGIIFAYVTLWCGLDQQKINFGIFKVRKIFLPWMYLFITQIIMPNTSFTCHLSGILCGTFIRYFMLDNTEHLNLYSKVVKRLTEKYRGYREIQNNMRIRQLEIGWEIP